MNHLPKVIKGIPHLISKQQLIQYANCSGDHNPLHLDQAFAERTPYGKPIAHGMLVLAFISSMMTASFGQRWLSGGKLKTRFRAPVYPGEEITSIGTFRAFSPDGRDAVYSVSCVNSSGTPAITGEATIPWNTATDSSSPPEQEFS
tara:strand:- start:48 stop:485 length:438 start_codon:yes stop_codon:yes gene_type:complete